MQKCVKLHLVTPEKLSIIVTHYKTPELLTTCLETLAAFAPNVPVTVVDSDSQDGTLAMLRQKHPRVQALSVPNHSLAGAVNAGLKQAKTPFVLHMNADVFINQDSLPGMLEQLSKPKVGIVGPRVRRKDGKWQDQGFFYKRYYLIMQLTGVKSIPVNWLSGCCQMLKREVIEQVGGMDSSLRFYNEDVEWCWRIRKAGWYCDMVRSEVTHLGGSSTPDDVKFLIEGYRGGYVLSQRYKPRWYQTIHKRIVQSEAFFYSRSKHEGKRIAYKTIAAMVKANALSESPFGATLNRRNPRFPFIHDS